MDKKLVSFGRHLGQNEISFRGAIDEDLAELGQGLALSLKNYVIFYSETVLTLNLQTSNLKSFKFRDTNLKIGGGPRSGTRVGPIIRM